MAGEGKYHRIVVLDKQGQPKDYPRDMPIFVLLGRDPHAIVAVEAYADDLGAKGDAAQAEDVRAFALNMRAWQIENPDAVKPPD